MSRYQTVTGLVINKRTIKESDLLITLLTSSAGKIIALAKGAKNIKSSRLGALQLGNVIQAHLYEKDNFFWISETRTQSNFLTTRKTLTQLNLLFYFLELLNTLIADNQQIEGMFQIALNVITAINQNSLNRYIANEIEFLKILGFGVPQEIQQSYLAKDYKTTQKYIKQFLESIIEKKLESNKLFK